LVTGHTRISEPSIYIRWVKNWTKPDLQTLDVEINNSDDGSYSGDDSDDMEDVDED
jgi:hypothetical protein